MSAEDREDPPRVRAIRGLTAQFTPEEAEAIEEVAARTDHTAAEWLREVALDALPEDAGEQP